MKNTPSEFFQDKSIKHIAALDHLEIGQHEHLEVWYQEDPTDSLLLFADGRAVLFDDLFNVLTFFPIDPVTPDILKRCGWEKICDL